MGLMPKDPLLQGTRRSATLALPEPLWDALEKESVIEDAKSKSAFAAELLAWAIGELRARRAQAAQRR